MAAQGGTNLRELITSMSPTLHHETFVFAHVPAESDVDLANVLKLFSTLPVQMLFREAEGWTVILPETVAKDVKLQCIFPCKRVTLNVHSSLEAVGFLAAVTARLTELNVGVNPVSAYFHDHLFIPVGKEEAVIEVLRKMTKEG